MQERNENASLPCQYSHLNLNGLPLRSVSSFSFHLIKYDINAHELMKTLNVCACVYVCVSHATLRSVHFKRTQNMLFNSSLTIEFVCYSNVAFMCGSHLL